jgi:UDP-glucuronate 4-epimerase
LKKILVIGSAGFIGFHLSKKLNRLGFHVVGLDSLNDYYDVKLKLARLQQLGVDPDGKSTKPDSLFRFIKLDLVDKELLSELFEREQFNYVIHLAAQAEVRYSLKNPQSYIDNNIQCFINILEACRIYPPEHLIFASSSSVYGLNQQLPFSTKHHTDHPVSLYAATKKANEMMAHSYAHLFKIPATGLRFFTVYGPWGRPNMAYFSFTR